MAELAALPWAVGGFHNLPTGVAVQAVSCSVASALVRDGNSTSWLKPSWLFGVSVCLGVKAMGIGTGGNSGAAGLHVGLEKLKSQSNRIASICGSDTPTLSPWGGRGHAMIARLAQVSGSGAHLLEKVQQLKSLWGWRFPLLRLILETVHNQP